MTKKKVIELGDFVRDTITGFKGVAVSVTRWLNGCVQYEVQPKIDKKGEIPDSYHIDAVQLRIVKRGNQKKAEPIHGGHRNNPTRR